MYLIHLVTVVGTIRINSNGVYKLRMIATDDMGSTGEFTLMLRIFPLPIGVLEANPDYLYYASTGGGLDQWQTKENVRYDIRSNPSIVDDEWGPAWHYMDFSSDDWTVTPLDNQDKSVFTLQIGRISILNTKIPHQTIH